MTEDEAERIALDRERDRHIFLRGVLWAALGALLILVAIGV